MLRTPVFRRSGAQPKKRRANSRMVGGVDFDDVDLDRGK